MGGGLDSAAGRGKECVAVVDCKVWGRAAYINDKVFAIDIGRFGGEGQKQLQVFGDTVDKKM
jgi:hypothetical protein